MERIRFFARTGRSQAVVSALAVIGFSLGLVTVAPAAEPTVTAPPVKLTVIKAAQTGDGYNRRVRIHNRTGWTMLRFYASDSRTDDWEEDILGADTLTTGRSLMINIDDGSGACVYDFKAEFTNGETLTRYRINVCQIADYYYTR